MKKHVKAISALALALAVGGGDTIAHAQSPASTAKKEKKNTYASQIKAVKETVKTNRDSNKTLEQSIKEKRDQIKAKVAQLKQDKALKAKKADLKAQEQKIKEDVQALKKLKTTVKPEIQTIKNDKASKDFQQLLSDLNNLPSLQNQRTQLLQQLNSDLATLLGMLN